MNTKLTLNINKDIIESAKEYAKSSKVSLSQLIENYLNSLTKNEEKVKEVSALVQNLTGVLPKYEPTDLKRAHYEYLNKKYS